MFGKFTLFKHLAEKVWQMNRSAKGLLMVTISLDGFSLVKYSQFANFAKLSTCQTFLLYVYIVYVASQPSISVHYIGFNFYSFTRLWVCYTTCQALVVENSHNHVHCKQYCHNVWQPCHHLVQCTQPCHNLVTTSLSQTWLLCMDYIDHAPGEVRKIYNNQRMVDMLYAWQKF